MLTIFKNKKAQNTAEYAILIALVVGGVIAMQTYTQRALQGRLRDASVGLRDQTNSIGKTLQYEPYYTVSKADKDKTSEKLESGKEHSDSTITQTRANTYMEATTYTNAGVVSTENADEAGM
ncbi:MAG: hypothetical protein V2A70_04235 [Candidatus Omnitrophota bacterium]